MFLWAAPVLKPVDESGYGKLIEEEKGRVLLVVFWSTTCPYCIEELPRLADLSAKFGRWRIHIVTVSNDTPENRDLALQALREHHVPGHWFINEFATNNEFIQAVDPGWNGSLPAFFLYDRTGKLVRHFSRSVELPVLEAAVRKLL
jgi:hypothetical protein